MIKNKILITGASGFVGKALVEKLVKENANIFLVSRDKKFKVKKAKVFYGDLADKNFCKKIVKNIDTVNYLAGFKKNISIHTKETFDTASLNILPFLNFLESVKDSSVKEIIYASSVVVQYARFFEGEKIDGYVLGKYINELVLKAFMAQTGIVIKTVRIAPVYGPNNDFDPKTANIIPALIVKISQAVDYVEVWGKGKRKLQFIYINDLVENLVAILKSKENFFSIGNSQTIEVNDLVKKIIKIMDKNLKIRNDISKPDKESQVYEFRNLIKPKFDLVTGIQETIKKYNQNAK